MSLEVEETVNRFEKCHCSSADQFGRVRQIFRRGRVEPEIFNHDDIHTRLASQYNHTMITIGSLSKILSNIIIIMSDNYPPNDSRNDDDVTMMVVDDDDERLHALT